MSRRVLPGTDGLMLVEVHFKKGGVGEAHAHAEHEQVSYVLKGRFEVEIGSERKILKAGQGFVAARNVRHGVLALEDSIILDAFSPARKDFL
jgi:quercetin dioxygenase-like cupin family protein